MRLTLSSLSLTLALAASFGCGSHDQGHPGPRQLPTLPETVGENAGALGSGVPLLPLDETGPIVALGASSITIDSRHGTRTFGLAAETEYLGWNSSQKRWEKSSGSALHVGTRVRVNANVGEIALRVRVRR